MPSRPNILCFITDQQRADHLSCYGNPDIQTPHIARLAAQGITCTEAYVANPVCMPNRASLFTGQYPKSHGVRENGMGLSPDTTTLPEMLRQNGYRTASFGKLHLKPYGIEPHNPAQLCETCETPEHWDNGHGLPQPYFGLESVYFTGGHGPYIFGDYMGDVGRETHALLRKEHALRTPSGAKESWKSAIPPEKHYTTRIADKTIEFIEAADTERPFFVWCSFPDPHHPYMPPAPYCDMYDPNAIRFAPARREGELAALPPYFAACHSGEQRVGGLTGGAQISEADYREILAHTYGMISLIDVNVGRVMDALEKRNFLENTVIVFMSDHGDMMGDHWLINKGPFPFRGLVRVPTIWRLPGAENAGHQTSAFVSAVDFLPTALDFAGVKVPHGVQGISYRDVLSGERPGIRDEIYIEYDETYLGDRLRHLRTDRWALTHFANSEYGLLFDLKNDPQELNNLWNSNNHFSVRQQLLLRLLDVTSQNDSWLPARWCHA